VRSIRANVDAMRIALFVLCLAGACERARPPRLDTAVLGRWETTSQGNTYELSYAADGTGENSSGAYHYRFHWHVAPDGTLVRHVDDLDSDTVNDVVVDGDVMRQQVHGGDASTWQRIR
jgi:hypothetical protein